MNCRKCRRLIPKYLDGELAEGDALRVRAHLDACHDCRAETDSILKTLDLLAQWGPIEPRLGVDALRERLKQRAERTLESVLPVPRWAAAALAVFSIGVGTALGLRGVQVEPRKPGSEVQVANAVGLSHYDDLVEASIVQGVGNPPTFEGGPAR